MPELPEVESLKISLEKIILNKVISNTKIYRNKIRYQLDDNLEFLQNSEIVAIRRRAKYLIIDLSIGKSLIVHLGMSGKFFLTTKFAIQDKHDHIVFELQEQDKLIFNDVRRFGMVYLLQTKEIFANKIFYNLGVEPLANEFNEDYLFEKVKTKSQPIKTSLMDNSIVVGIGNIYASEILFRANISPLRLCKSLNMLEIRNIINITKLVLQEAINFGGTTLKDFIDAEKRSGNYSNKLLAYGKKNCYFCFGDITIIKQAGRSSYYCKNCQK